MLSLHDLSTFLQVFQLPPTVIRHTVYTRLIGESHLPVGVNVSMHGCVGTVINL